MTFSNSCLVLSRSLVGMRKTRRTRPATVASRRPLHVERERIGRRTFLTFQHFLEFATAIEAELNGRRTMNGERSTIVKRDQWRASHNHAIMHNQFEPFHSSTEQQFNSHLECNELIANHLLFVFYSSILHNPSNFSFAHNSCIFSCTAQSAR